MDLFATTALITSSFDIEDEDTYPPQFLFAKHRVPELMESVASFDVFPVSCLNVHAILQFFVGVVDRESAEFIHKISTCREVSIHAMHNTKLHTEDSPGTFEVSTVFNDNDCSRTRIGLSYKHKAMQEKNICELYSL